MSRTWFTIILPALLLGLFLNACSGRQAKPRLGPDETKALFEARCSQCHGLNIVFEERYTEAGWRKLVKREAARKVWSIRGWEQEVIAAYLFGILPGDKDLPPEAGPQGVEIFADPPTARDG